MLGQVDGGECYWDPKADHTIQQINSKVSPGYEFTSVHIALHSIMMQSNDHASSHFPDAIIVLEHRTTPSLHFHS
jgi:hypothetical protein